MERGWFLVGGGLAHCWVLKHQGREDLVASCAGGWVFLGLLVLDRPLVGWLLSFVSCARLGVWGVGGVVV